MPKADCVHSTPPTNTPIDTTRRGFLGSTAAALAAGTAVNVAALAAIRPTLGAEVDPIFALIEEHKKANADFYAAVAEVVPGTLSPDPEKEAFFGGREGDVRWTLTSTAPTTLAGLLALFSYIEGVSDGSCSPNGKPDHVFHHAEDEVFNVIVNAREFLASHLNPGAT